MGNYKQQLNSFYKGKMERHEVFSLGRTPTLLKQYGLPDLNIIMTQNTARKITRPEAGQRTGHGISRQIMKDLKRQLEQPVMIIKNPENDAFIIVSDKTDKNGNFVIIAIHK